MSPLVRGLRHQIARQLRDDIATGRFREGDPLREVELSKRFGTSRGPIRDALLELTKEGVVVAQRNGGVAVAPPVGDEITKLITPIRQTIETYALGMIFDSLEAGDFATFQRCVDHMQIGCQRGDHALVAEADLAFHRAILDRAGNHCLMAIWSTIVGQLQRHFTSACREYANLMDYHAEHVALIEAFQSGNRAAAVKALEEHIRWPIRQSAEASTERAS
ncbi:MAG: GntR family transcriptional regulator [Planctomycetales bacterium]|jgi:DNA-binding GntR family transcriptional regulator|nr:GntR family transcriptional regulator [Planctomycetales bacterium]MBN8629122.1 GntR family transcriptional regulator [Planctomycetota bacterium]